MHYIGVPTMLNETLIMCYLCPALSAWVIPLGSLRSASMAIRLSRTREAKAHLTAPFHVTDRNWRLKTIDTV